MSRTVTYKKLNLYQITTLLSNNFTCYAKSFRLNYPQNIFSRRFLLNDQTLFTIPKSILSSPYICPKYQVTIKYRGCINASLFISIARAPELYSHRLTPYIFSPNCVYPCLSFCVSFFLSVCIFRFALRCPQSDAVVSNRA